MAARRTKTSAAAQYAEAMLDLANQAAQAPQVGQELSDLKQVVSEEPTFALFLKDPSISMAERLSVIQKVFAGRVSPLVMNLLGVMNSHGRLGILGEVADRYRELLDTQLGNVAVDVTVVRPMDAQELETVRARISAALGKNAVLRERVDESIIGGLVVRVGDKVMDGSVRAQLAAMKRKLMAGTPRV
jgi:F-type H+-transporting ATPase subunit delta